MSDADPRIHGYRWWVIDELGRLRSPYRGEYIWAPGDNAASKLYAVDGKNRGLYSWWDPRRGEAPQYSRYDRFDEASLIYGTVLVDPKNLVTEYVDRSMDHSQAKIAGVVKPSSACKDPERIKKKIKNRRSAFFLAVAFPVLLFITASIVFGGVEPWILWLTGIFGLIAWAIFETKMEVYTDEINLDMSNRWKRFEHNYPEVEVFNDERDMYARFPYPDFLDVSRTPETDPTFWRNP